MRFLGFIPFIAALGVGLMTQAAMATGDPVKGKAVAKKCTACHTMNKGGKNRLGPNLYDIVNQPAASVPGFRYSKAMKASGVTWTEPALAAFFVKPKKFIKSTKMSFAGIKSAKKRADLVAYLKTLADAKPTASNHGDAVKGKTAAVAHCAVCHSFERGGKLVFGPSLFDTYGKLAARDPDYDYSAALKNAGLVWTDVNLTEFMASPEQFIKGTKARFPGVDDANTRADIAAYLRTLK
jgi:cytochrome c